MSDPFTRFGIKNLSASSLNKWRAEPKNWGRYYLKGEREDGPFFWRGDAVEAGLYMLLREEPIDVAVAEAHRIFEQKALGDLTEDVEAERKLITPMVNQAKLWKPPGELNATQLKVELHFQVIPVPILGYLDFAFDGIDVDCKSTKKLPSAPSWDHVRQVSLYRTARGRRGALLYVTDKRNAFFEIGDEQMNEAMASLESDALSLMKQLRRAADADDFIAALPDFERFEKRATTRPALEATANG